MNDASKAYGNAAGALNEGADYLEDLALAALDHLDIERARDLLTGAIQIRADAARMGEQQGHWHGQYWIEGPSIK